MTIRQHRTAADTRTETLPAMATNPGLDRTRRIWDRYAPRYDNELRAWERFMFADGRAWVCQQAVGDTLEIAVGTGLNLPYYPAEVRLTGVDLSPAMLARARRRATDLGRTVELREANAHHLPFDAAAFDTAVCTLALCSIPDPHAAIAEMYRVLRPGGRLLLLDHVAVTNPLLRTAQRLFEIITSRIAAEYQTVCPQPLLRRAGFRIDASQRFKAGTIERLRASKPVP